MKCKTVEAVTGVPRRLWCWAQNTRLYKPAQHKPMAYCTLKKGHCGPHVWARY